MIYNKVEYVKGGMYKVEYLDGKTQEIRLQSEEVELSKCLTNIKDKLTEDELKELVSAIDGYGFVKWCEGNDAAEDREYL